MKTKMETKMETKKRVICHGECVILQCDTLPADAIAETQTGCFTIVANSEVTGNHHVIDNKPGVTFLNSPKTGKRYMNSSVDTSIRCVMAERHTEIPLPAGLYEMGIAQEFDYLSQAKRNVAD